MSMIAFIGNKGGIGKSTNAHLVCLGAVLCKVPAIYILTDPKRKIRAAGRPYGVWDGRNPADLARMLSIAKTESGIFAIDGGGNRPAFDTELANIADLAIIPFKNTDEDLDPALDDLAANPQAYIMPSAWPPNALARQAAQKYITRAAKTTDRLIMPPVSHANSITELLSEELESPSTEARAAARKLFNIVYNYLPEATAPFDEETATA